MHLMSCMAGIDIVLTSFTRLLVVCSSFKGVPTKRKRGQRMLQQITQAGHRLALSLQP